LETLVVAFLLAVAAPVQGQWMDELYYDQDVQR